MDHSQRIEALEKLASLRQSGHLSDDEFATAKRQIIGEIQSHLGEPELAAASMGATSDNSEGLPNGSAEIDADYEYDDGYLYDEGSKFRSTLVKAAIFVVPLLIVAVTYWKFRDGGDDPNTLVVTASQLNCRTLPAADSEAISVFAEGDRIEALQHQDGWAMVESAEGNCWLSEDYLRALVLDGEPTDE